MNSPAAQSIVSDIPDLRSASLRRRFDGTVDEILARAYTSSSTGASVGYGHDVWPGHIGWPF